MPVALNITYTATNGFPTLPQVEEKLHYAIVNAAEKVEESVETNVDQKLNTTGLATGALRDSFSILYDGQFKASVVSNSVYASVQEFGGTIHAKNAPFLVFRTSDGLWHSVREVTIPARPFMQPALEQNRSFIEEQISSVVSEYQNK